MLAAVYGLQFGLVCGIGDSDGMAPPVPEGRYSCRRWFATMRMTSWAVLRCSIFRTRASGRYWLKVAWLTAYVLLNSRLLRTSRTVSNCALLPASSVSRMCSIDACMVLCVGCVDDRSTACARQACSDAVQHTSHAGTQAAPGCARATVTVWKEGFQKASFRWFGCHAGGVPDRRANAGKDLLQARW